MRKYLLVSLGILVGWAVKAQVNLVPNPSFEDYSDCPQFYPDLEGKCNSWTSFRGTPDYINNCSTVCGFSNNYGYQVARTGQAYAGLASFQVTTLNGREHVGVELLSPLEIGTIYYVSFYVSCGYTYLGENIATNMIGAKFTTYKYGDPNMVTPLPNTCQLYTDNIISDTLNWVQVTGSITADSAYKYIIIGSFFDDSHIDTIHFPYQVVPQSSYYYVDDVCVSTDPMLCGVSTASCFFMLPTAFTPNNDNVNDSYTCVENCSSVDEFEMRIYNRWGELLFATNDHNVGWDGNYKGELQPMDVYGVYVSVTSQGKQVNKSASITLLR